MFLFLPLISDYPLDDGDISFKADLVKMPVDVKNAERIFKHALEVLKGEEPAADPECGFCGWAIQA